MGLRILSIDPSMRRIGWALFEMEPGVDFNDLNNWNYGTCSPPVQGSRSLRLASVKQFFARADAAHLVCEMPMFFNSERGRIAAKEGYTNDLALVIGTIYGLIPNVRLYLYTVQQWKGAVPKTATRAKFKRVFKLTYVNQVHDTVDAIMLLRYHVATQFANVRI